MSRKIHLAIIGSRGIPGNYGGFETFAEKLSLGMVERGHRVIIYCPSSYSQLSDQHYRGIRRVIIPNIALKSIDKLSSSFLSCIHSLRIDADVVLFLGVSPVLFALLPKLSGKKTVINIDGLEWKREKWNRLASSYLKLSESLSGIICDTVVTDSIAIQKYFRKQYGKDSTFIAYGADIGTVEDKTLLKRYGLEKDKYVLQVCRLEPENNSDLIIREYCQTDIDMPLVIIGSSPYGSSYLRELKRIADERVRFLGGVYGYDYNVLRSNPFCYIHGHEVGGTNPALLEALAAGNCVVVLDVAYNMEVIEGAGLSFSKDRGSLETVLKQIENCPDLREEMKQKSVERIQNNYTWEYIIDQYERLFLDLLP